MPSRARKDGRVALRVAPGDEAGRPAAEAVVARAQALGVQGWVRAGFDSPGLLHAEGSPEAVAALVEFLGAGAGERATKVPVEGHEQFAIRGVSAGAFVIAEHLTRTRHFDLRLQVGDIMRSWALPRGPSLDPAVKRLAVQVADHPVQGVELERASGGEAAIVWDRGTYEQGGRVPWPEALIRGHAVFVLHGRKLTGGFALQRTRAASAGAVTAAAAGTAGAGAGEGSQWLLVKRRDVHARAGSEITAEQPQSVVCGLTVDDLAQRGSGS